MPARHDSARRSTRWAVAFACWVAFIWCHSLVQGPQSSAESGAVVALVRPLLEALGIGDVDLMTVVVRKTAHFLEYAVLGVLARGLLSSLHAERGARPLPCAPLVALVPVIDETIQLSVPGRSGQVTDVLIDLAGLVTGAIFSHLVARALRGRR